MERRKERGERRKEKGERRKKRREGKKSLLIKMLTHKASVKDGFEPISRKISLE